MYGYFCDALPEVVKFRRHAGRPAIGVIHSRGCKAVGHWGVRYDTGTPAPRRNGSPAAQSALGQHLFSGSQQQRGPQQQHLSIHAFTGTCNACSSSRLLWASFQEHDAPDERVEAMVPLREFKGSREATRYRMLAGVPTTQLSLLTLITGSYGGDDSYFVSCRAK